MTESDRNNPSQNPNDIDAFFARVQQFMQMTPEEHDWERFVERTKDAFAKTLLFRNRNWRYSDSHPVQLEEIGAEWHLIRETDGKGISIQEASEKSGIWWGDIVLFEAGFLDPRDEDPDFLDNLAAAYGAPELATGYKIMHQPGGDVEMRRFFDKPEDSGK